MLNRIILNVLASIFFLLPALVFGLMEYGSVARENCNWGSGEFCTDYKGVYGIAAAVFGVIWLALTWLINRKRKSRYAS